MALAAATAPPNLGPRIVSLLSSLTESSSLLPHTLLAGLRVIAYLAWSIRG
jgi:hypothetical protein